MDEDNDEECLVLVELSGIIDNDFLHTCDGKCKILGMETKNPVLQLGHYVFKGEYEDTLGTAVLFEEVAPEASTNSDDRGLAFSRPQPVSKNMKLFDMTRKKLNMTRVFLSKKHNTNMESEEKS